jgi:hypothetical protein
MSPTVNGADERVCGLGRAGDVCDSGKNDTFRQLQGTGQHYKAGGTSTLWLWCCIKGALVEDAEGPPALYSASVLGALDEQLFHCCPPPCIKPADRKSHPWAARRIRCPYRRRLRRDTVKMPLPVSNTVAGRPHNATEPRIRPFMHPHTWFKSFTSRLRYI